MTQATNTTLGEIKLAGDLAGNNNALAPELTATGVTPGSYTFPSITVDSKGRITAASNGVSTDLDLPLATSSVLGVVKVGSGLSVASGVVALDAPVATTSVKGTLKVGSNINVSSGVISVPTATNAVKGVCSIGSGLSVASGVVSLNVPDANGSGTKGLVTVGSGLSVAGGQVSVPDATGSSKGIVSAGAGLQSTAGVLSVVDATASVKGICSISTGLSVTGGAVSAVLADGTTTFGIVKSNNTSNITIANGLIDVGSNVAKLDTANVYTKSQATAISTLTYGATITPDFSLSNVFYLDATGNFTLANPTNAVAGGIYQIIVKQDATGSRLITFGSAYKFRGVAPALTTTGGKVDIISLVVQSSTFILTELQKGYS